MTDSTLTYRLHTQELGDVVLKKADIVNRPEAVELMKHEILVYRHLQSLQGIHIPILRFAGVSDGIEFVLVTEYVGESIEKLTLSMEDCVMIVESLNALHDAGVVHGDVRLENITRLQHDNGKHEFRFIDFGLSKPTEGRDTQDEEMEKLEKILEAIMTPQER